jgi:hypothetical protein
MVYCNINVVVARSSGEDLDEIGLFVMVDGKMSVHKADKSFIGCTHREGRIT